MSKFKEVMSNIGNKFKRAASKVWERLKEKNFGFYVACAAWLLTFIHMITYSQIGKVGEGLFSIGVIISCVIGLVAFVVLAWFKETSRLAPVALMVCDLLCLMFFVKADNFQDFFSTQFFDGFSIGKVFSLGVPLWFSLFSFIISFIIASAAIYMPQERKREETCHTDDRSEKTEQV